MADPRRDPRFVSAPLRSRATSPTAAQWPTPDLGESPPALPVLARVELPVERVAIDLRDGAYYGCVALFFGVMLTFAFVYRSKKRPLVSPARPRSPPRRTVAASQPSQPSPFEVRRISIAFDWTERRRLQEALDEMADSVDTDSSAAFLAAADGARDLLRSALGAARYAAVARFLTSPAQAEVRYQKISRELAVRFREETHHDAVRIAREAMTARAQEGEGLVVVTLLVASAMHLRELPASLDRGALASALDGALPSAGDDLVAFEVIWSPSEDGDRMSSAELETLYPDLLPVDPADGAIGRVQCGYCRALYAAELGECPSCGAPVASAKRV